MKLTKFKINLEILLLFLIISLGAFLRFYKLSEIPNGFYVDEAAVGYNAYSILKTGLDEYGKSYPVLFRFLGSYSPPLYVYLTSIVISFLGLSVYSVRFLSALAGTSGILIIYFFFKYLKISESRHLPLVGAFVFSIAPWTIFFSRTGYEVNFGFIVFLLGMTLILAGLKNPKVLVAGFIVSALAMYTSFTELYLVPLIVIGLLIFFKKIFLSETHFRYTLTGLLAMIILGIPYLTVIFTPAFITKDSLFYSSTLANEASKMPVFIPRVIVLFLAFTREFFSKMVTYLSPKSLFFLPDPDPQRSLPELSVFYPWMVAPFLIGIYIFWEKRKEISVKFTLLVFLMTAILGSLVRDPFSTQRALPLALPLIVIISLGIEKIIEKFSLKIWLPVGLTIIIVSLLFLWRSYFVLLPKERARVWGYGFHELAQEVSTNQNEEFVIDQDRTKPIYIELAFFMKYPPEKFHEEIDQAIKNNYYSDIAYSGYYKFGNVEIRSINWEKDIYKNQILVGDELSISGTQAKEHFLTKVFEIKDPIEQTVFVGFKTNPQEKCAATKNFSLYCKGIK